MVMRRVRRAGELVPSLALRGGRVGWEGLMRGGGMSLVLCERRYVCWRRGGEAARVRAMMDAMLYVCAGKNTKEEKVLGFGMVLEIAGKMVGCLVGYLLCSALI